MTDTITVTRRTEHALRRLLTAANGGTTPERLDIHVLPAGAQMAFAYDPTDGRTKLLVTSDTDGRLDVSVGVATSWTTLFHDGYRFARTGGGQLVLLGTTGGRRTHFWLEEDRLWCDLGSPLLSADDEEAAMAAFDAELATLVAEMA